ncbi:translation machinery-associated protein [Acrasis kona]|uniref:Translation machinery-associated protein n=1 Tax=Acrasis kona TaxID=1008807 RepID=A0AAW2ZFE4_9EUKA
MVKKKGGSKKKKYESSDEEDNTTKDLEVETESDKNVDEAADKVKSLTVEDSKPKVEAEKQEIKETSSSDKKYPVSVNYCKVCTLPIEFCEFCDKWVKCQEYLAEAFPDKLKELQDLRENDKNKNKVINKKVAAEAEGREPSGKPKKKVEAELVITITKRTKHKAITTITGMDHFGVDASALAKTLKKKFSSGASLVSKPEPGIEIQGTFATETFEILQKDFNVPAENMFLVAEKKKTKFTDL